MLYARYLLETLGQHYLEDEAGRGFLTYSHDSIPGLDIPHTYIVDLYTVPEHRKSGVAAQLADRVAAEARETGRRYLFGSVCKHAKTREASQNVLKAYGMRKYSEDADMVWYLKEI